MSKFSAEKIYALFETPANKQIISRISDSGAGIVLFPAVETSLIETAATKEILNDLSSFDWLVFRDIYTVEFFLHSLEESNTDFFEMDELRVCACGESVSDRLRFAQLHADVIPHGVKLEDVFQSLNDYICGGSFKNLRFLILGEASADSELKNKLEAFDASVAELAIYAAENTENENLVKLKTLLKGGAIDEFIFNTPFDVLNLAHLFPNENLETVLKDISLFATDNITEQSLKEFRLI